MNGALKSLLIPMFAFGIGATGADTVPLELELPEPLFMGTPKPVGEIENLAPPRVGDRPTLQIPAGVKNLAAGRGVTSSDDWPIIGDISYATDGDKQGDEGYFVELGPGRQWIQIDLGKPAEIFAIVAWRYHAEPRVYHDIVIRIGDDASFKNNVRTVFNNDHDNSSGLGAGKDHAFVETHEGQLVEVDGTTGRYVRLYSNGNTSNPMNHYIEVEVYGRFTGE